MSAQRIIELIVNLDDKGLKEFQSGLKNAQKETKNLGDVAEKTNDRYSGSIRKNNILVEKLNDLTGGTVNTMLDLGDAAKKSGLAMRSAFVATGIGAFVVALGLVVAYWEDIKDFITGSNTALERQLDYYAEMGNLQQRDVDLLNKKDNILKLQGKSQLEINKLKEKELEDVIKIRQQELELAKQRLQEIEDLKTAGGSSLEQIARFSQALMVNLGKQVDDFLGRFGLKTKFTESAVGSTNSIIEGIFGTEEDLKNARDRVNALEDEILSAQNTIAGFQLAEREGTTTEEQVDRPRNLETLQTQKSTEVQIFTDAEKLKTQAVVDSLIEQERLRKEAAAQERRIAQAEAEYKIQTAANVLGALQGLAEQGSAGAKAIAVAQAVVSTYQGINKALAETTDFTPTQSLRFLNAALVGVAGFANVAKILSTDSSGATVPTGIGGGGVGSQPQAPSFNVVGQSGVNQLADTLNQEQQPIQAFVVGSQVTTQQELDNNIVNTANIG
jgi:hypothetical protein